MSYRDAGENRQKAVMNVPVTGTFLVGRITRL